MPTAAQHRKVLIVGDAPSITGLLRVFGEKTNLKKPGEADPAALLARVDRKTFDSVLLDLRCPKPSGQPGGPGSGEIRSSLMGRVLTITAEVRDAETLDLIERYLKSGLPRPLLWLVSDR